MWGWLTRKLDYQKAVFIINCLSALAFVRSLFSWPTFFKQAPYAEQPIAIVALFEKGILRSDIVALLTELRRQNIYILGVNTLKLQKGSPEIELFDTYVEIFNFGRDFGMYKFAFTYVFKQGWHKICPRLLMVNDSIFFSRRGLAQFITDMMASDKDALGATENFDYEHHVGSFCISYSNFVLNHKKFKKFWYDYRRTDVRPVVIKRGEITLSKILKKIVRHQQSFSALYDVVRFSKILSCENNVSLFLDNVRTSSLVPFRRIDATSIIEFFCRRYDAKLNHHQTMAVKTNLLTSSSSKDQLISNRDDYKNNLFVLRYKDISPAIEKIEILKEGHTENDVAEFVKNCLVDMFISGSQIHQNATILVLMGLPIIKMDSVYRGAFNIEDVYHLVEKLPQPDQDELFQHLLSRPYGANWIYSGWKRTAFLYGLI